MSNPQIHSSGIRMPKFEKLCEKKVRCIAHELPIYHKENGNSF
jgi:hypothetical protein